MIHLEIERKILRSGVEATDLRKRLLKSIGQPSDLRNLLKNFFFIILSIVSRVIL